MLNLKEASLAYHKAKDIFDTNGKTATLLTKPCETADDLSMAYSPGVAYPCLEIQKDIQDAYTYTNKGNLVAVISDGSAVLGLGDIGHLAGKPVMEGKCALFKKFAKIDAVDIEINTQDIEQIIKTVASISDSFGGINLEDISAPRCFEIEERLKEICSVPVFHDDQHGTAVITGAALKNALEIQNKKIQDIKAVIIGAGAAAISCAKMYRALGVKNIVMVDSKGVISSCRDDLNAHKREFAVTTTDRSLSDALKDADVVLGLSSPNSITKEMVASMSPRPIIFACANPTPEIMPNIVKSIREDAIVATGRSDFANQVNNVLCFPFIFRGALDVRATKITQNMKMAASDALASLAKEPVSSQIAKLHAREEMVFSREYIIPSPFDKRVMEWVSYAVAKAAIMDGVAQIREFDLDTYREKLRKISNQ